ncbi:MAG: hypothetical protein R3328_09265 [Planococcaceae bacterium]|nr:hypothetical protein [Planococcaceae bacterium]
MNNHPNYRVSVEVILVHEDKILLTKRSTEAVVMECASGESEI